MTLQYYAGIGPRDKVPESILAEMSSFGARMAREGLGLRSGAARGSDSAFERGCDTFFGEKQIFLPWKGFNNHTSEFIAPPPEAYLLIDKLWSDAKYRSHAVRSLFARNCQQILGPNLDDPSQFVMCWTPGGKIVGGTGRAIRIAKSFNIPVVNLFDSSYNESLYSF